MAFGDIQGYARTDPRAPRAKGVCDDCGRWFLHSRLLRQMEYRGTALEWTGFFKCRECLDKPQDQLRPILLPPDPVPIMNPRPEYAVNDEALQGFTQYVLWPDGGALDWAVWLSDGLGDPIIDQYGNPILLEVSHDQIAVLAQVASLSGVAVPGTIIDRGGTIAAGATAQTLMPAAATRSYLLVFNPCSVPIGVSFATAQLGVSPTLLIGHGGALFQATALGAVSAAALTIVGNIAGLPFYAWEAP